MVEAKPGNYSRGEEIANSVIHGVGIVLSIAGLGILTAVAALREDAFQLVAGSIFGTTLILLYTASTLYHAIPIQRAKRILRTLDHAAIYLLIAGTYTPFALVNLRGPWGWSLFGVVWGIAVLGVVAKSIVQARKSTFSVVLYVAMGWVGIVAIVPMLKRIEPQGLLLLLAGGVAYTSGVVFYVWRRLPYHHAIWHGFVLTGSILHFFAVLFYAVPAGGIQSV